jgi:hypothetical protein
MRWTSRATFLAGAIGLALLVLTQANEASAELLTWEFSGELEFVDPSLEETFSVADPFVVFITFDPNTPDDEPSSPSGVYSGAINSFIATVEGYSISLPDGFIQVTNSSFDLFSFLAEDPNGLPAPPIGIFELVLAAVQLQDPNATALDSDEIPLTPPDPSEFLATFFLIFEDPNDNAASAFGTITSITEAGLGVPTVSHWGVIIFAALLLASSIWMIQCRLCFRT